ncbi:MAG: hypothetical protein OXG60_08615 [Chloroflexi bacterium]|nr:hypothetical protein [Chloroflexota bacterium]
MKRASPLPRRREEDALSKRSPLSPFAGCHHGAGGNVIRLLGDMTFTNSFRLMPVGGITPKTARTMLALAALLLCLSYLTETHVNAQENPPSQVDAREQPLQAWLPVPLISDESGVAFALLQEHTSVFSSNNNIDVEYRIKNVGVTGGIMSSIRSASEVAPGALPDVALIRRRDFTPTQARQYLYSMETLFSSALISDLGIALEFGQIPQDGGMALYGLPYFFEVLHAVSTQPLADAALGVRFDDVLSHGATLLFPAARSTGLNQTFYLQYLAAGGSASRNDVVAIDEGALFAVLEFYEQLVNQELIPVDVLSYQAPADYRPEFLSNSDPAKVAVFASSEYLSMLDQHDIELFPSNIPTANGESLATRDGWLWVIITPDQTRQTLSARFLEWMTEPAFHAEFAKALYQLPTQPAILRESLPENVDHQFFEDLLYKGILPLPESEGGSAPRIMQEALAQVLHGEASAASATRQVMNQFGGR